MMKASDNEIIERTLATIFGLYPELRGTVDFTHVTRWASALPHTSIGAYRHIGEFNARLGATDRIQFAADYMSAAGEPRPSVLDVALARANVVALASDAALFFGQIGRVTDDAPSRMLVAVGGVLYQLVLGLLEAFRFTLSCFGQRALGLITFRHYSGPTQALGTQNLAWLQQVSRSCLRVFVVVAPANPAAGHRSDIHPVREGVEAGSQRRCDPDRCDPHRHAEPVRA